MKISDERMLQRSARTPSLLIAFRSCRLVRTTPGGSA